MNAPAARVKAGAGTGAGAGTDNDDDDDDNAGGGSATKGQHGGGTVHRHWAGAQAMLAISSFDSEPTTHVLPRCTPTQAQATTQKSRQTWSEQTQLHWPSLACLGSHCSTQAHLYTRCAVGEQAYTPLQQRHSVPPALLIDPLSRWSLCALPVTTTGG